jgi:hypothetical protein
VVKAYNGKELLGEGDVKLSDLMDVVTRVSQKIQQMNTVKTTPRTNYLKHIKKFEGNNLAVEIRKNGNISGTVDIYPVDKSKCNE